MRLTLVISLLIACTARATTGRELMSASWQRPRVLVVNGCSGSTFVMKVARRLFLAHGLTVYGWEYELLNPAKNPFFNRSAVQKHGTSAATARALEAIHDDATRRRSVLLFNGAPGYLSEAVAAVLRKRDARLVHAWRRNVLDTLVCEVRDCFAHTTPTGKRAPGAADALGWPVDARTGARSSACFEQRRSKRANSTAATTAAAVMGPTKAHLNVSSLVGLLPLDSPSRVASFLRSRRLATAVSLSTEELSDFSLAAPSREEAQVHLRRSAAAWERALTAWGVPTNAEQLSRLLAAERDRLQATPHVVTPHAQTIANMAEVTETLRRAGPAYAALLRTDSGG